MAGQILAQEDLPQLVKKIQPAVVTVIVYDAKGKVIRQGTGFFINQEGHFITNYHVLEGASRVEVISGDGYHYTFKAVVAEDRPGDLALAAIEDRRGQVAPGVEYLGPISLRISTIMPEVGERVIVVGSPMGLEQTLSEGIVSAIRHIPEFGEILQITAPISPGFSGSPVVNMKGEVIGVATLQMRIGQNLNFAIPGNRMIVLQQKTVGPQVMLPKPPIAKEKPNLPIEGYGDSKDFFNQGRTFFKAGEYEKAIQALEQAICLKPDHAQAHYILGWAYNKVRRYQEGVTAFEQVIKNKPNYGLAYAGLGWTYNQLGRYQEAIEACKQAIRLNNNFADAHYTLGVAYCGVGNRSLALKEYKALQTLDKKLADELLNLIYK